MRFLWPWFGAWLALTGCIYDSENPCSENQRRDEDSGRCACVEGYVFDVERGYGCTACGANEVAAGASCECAIGFAREPQSGACVSLPKGLGSECDVGYLPCGDTVFDHCEVIDDGGTLGYCTSSSCASTADCEGGYACDLARSPSVCVRPPVGLNAPCSSNDDCAGFEATYCETFQSHQCMVKGCDLDPDDCFEGYQCCDLVPLGFDDTLCVPEGSCPTA